MVHASRSRPEIGTGRAGLNPPLQKGEAGGMPELFEMLQHFDIGGLDLI